MSEDSQLGSLLVERGLLTAGQLDAALAEQQRSRRSLGRVLIDQGLVTEVGLVSALAAQLGLEFVDVAAVPVDATAAGSINEALARRYQALPIGWEDGRLVVAMADPSNVFAVDDIRLITGSDVKMVVSTRTAIIGAIDEYHRAERAEEVIAAADEDSPDARLVDELIVRAVRDRASDIHIEPGEHDLRVRYRVDGVLHEAMRAPRDAHGGVVRRLKAMADLDVTERRLPQDGRISALTGARNVDLRLTTLPTVFGEKAVMRILDTSTAPLRLDDLGFLPATLERFEQAYAKPSGTILVTGPAGAGKSTTLYATLNVVTDDSKNAVSVEDPVECRLPGVNQVQVNAHAGLSFASALRSVLRSDPDVVLVGEMRDRETAATAVEAALAGQLVLSTLYTNDAASTPIRLVEMGVEPFLVASALECVVAQRLARRLCGTCKQVYQPSAAELAVAGWDDEADLPDLFRPIGCDACGGTGFHGRFALHEVMLVTEEIGRLVVGHAHSEDVKKVAVAQGMTTMRQAGLLQVLAGVTSMEEILRVVA